MENIVTVIFKVGSQGYQAFSEVKRDPFSGSYTVSQVALVQKEKGHIALKDSYDTGIQTADDTVIGGLTGSLVGILGGPIGMLLGGSLGLIAGSVIDIGDMDKNVTMAERVSAGMKDGDLALILMVQETDASALDSKFKAFDTVIIRQDAATVQDEIKEAERVQRELEKQAQKELRAQKSAERKVKIDQQKSKIKKAFEEFKEKNSGLKLAKSGPK